MSETKTDYADYAAACREIGLFESTITALDNRENTEKMKRHISESGVVTIFNNKNISWKGFRT